MTLYDVFTYRKSCEKTRQLHFESMGNVLSALEFLDSGLNWTGYFGSLAWCGAIFSFDPNKCVLRYAMQCRWMSPRSDEFHCNQPKDNTATSVHISDAGIFVDTFTYRLYQLLCPFYRTVIETRIAFWRNAVFRDRDGGRKEIERKRLRKRKRGW